MTPLVPRRSLSSRATPWLVAAAAAAAAVWFGLQVGRPRESMVVALVGVLAIGVVALSAPRSLVFVGGVAVFAADYGFAGVPLPELGAALITLGAVAAKDRTWSPPGLLLLSAPLLLIWVVVVAAEDIGDPTTNKRLLSLLLWVALMSVMAVSTNTRTTLAKGLLLGLLVSLPATVALGSYYGDRGAGLAGDPNSFAMVVAVTTPLIIDQLGLERWTSAGVWLFSAALIVMADSRTGMLSFATGLLVFILIPKIRALALAVPVIAAFGSAVIPDDIIRGGRWQDRAGSDDLRERIDAAGGRQIADSPWSGHGLGTGSVDLSVYGDPPQDLVFFLHNSYKSLVTEIGFIGVGLYAMVAIGAIVTGLRSPVARGALGAISAAAVMATQLGEVLFAIPLALALGFAWGSLPESIISTSEPGRRARKVPA